MPPLHRYFHVLCLFMPFGLVMVRDCCPRAPAVAAPLHMVVVVAAAHYYHYCFYHHHDHHHRRRHRHHHHHHPPPCTSNSHPQAIYVSFFDTQDDTSAPKKAAAGPSPSKYSHRANAAVFLFLLTVISYYFSSKMIRLVLMLYAPTSPLPPT